MKTKKINHVCGYVDTNGEFWLLLVFFCFNEQTKGHLLTNSRQPYQRQQEPNHNRNYDLRYQNQEAAEEKVT